MSESTHEDSLNNKIRGISGEALSMLSPVIKPEYGTGIKGVNFAMDLLSIDMRDLVEEERLRAVIAEMDDMLKGFSLGLADQPPTAKYVMQPLIRAIEKRITELQTDLNNLKRDGRRR